MSFSTDLNYIMTHDASLNSYCSGGIEYEKIPEDSDLDSTWIVYSFAKQSPISDVNGTIFMNKYSVTIKLITNDTAELELISDYLTNYLNNKTYNNILDTTFIDDLHSLELEKNIYMNTLNFEMLSK